MNYQNKEQKKPSVYLTLITLGQKVSRNIYRIIYEKNPDHPIDDLGFRYLFD